MTPLKTSFYDNILSHNRIEIPTHTYKFNWLFRIVKKAFKFRRHLNEYTMTNLEIKNIGIEYLI